MASVDPAPTHPPRLGPRPLGLHLATAMTTWLSSGAALPLSRSNSPGWNPEQTWHPSLRERSRALAHDLAQAEPEALRKAVGAEVRRRLDELERGIRLYRHHPYRRDAASPPSVWSQGTTRLLDYGVFAPRPEGAPLLVVPSLVNRGYILDLQPGRSLVRRLAADGFRPLFVDWGQPGADERHFDLTAYIAGRLCAALDRVHELTGRPPVVIGYCMGGQLALALAQLRSRDVGGLVLLATPWDFHAEKPEMARAVAATIAPWLPLFDHLDGMPVDVLQGLFAALDPFLVVRKFCAFARLDPASDRAREFVALEDWLNDGVPLAAAVARECLLGWYGDNTPGRGAWQVAGQPIRPESVAMPTLVVVPEQDRIVPPLSALALAKAVPGATVLTPSFGHIGMVSSSRAPKELWPQIAAWLRACLATDKAGGL
jgi:polyhydroxyalkanoate synthase